MAQVDCAAPAEAKLELQPEDSPKSSTELASPQENHEERSEEDDLSLTSPVIDTATEAPDAEKEDAELDTASSVPVRVSDDQQNIDDQLVDAQIASDSAPHRPRSISVASSKASSRSRSTDSASLSAVDWEGLEKTEEQEPKDEGTDESTALLLAMLEKENAALATDPKSSVSQPRRPRKDTRPHSIQQLKKLVAGPQRQSLRYSLLPAPPMTELEFWVALVQDYGQTVERLPTLTCNKIRSGVPPPLRGVVWPSIAGANDTHLHSEFQRLANEPSAYDALIGKDVGRSFPNVEMFRDKGGEGQAMLGRVLKAFSLYDEAIGYCQGLGFVVGPLLMHMSEPEAFSVLVRLVEHYDLRSNYLPDLSGLHLRIYQFQALLSRHRPTLAAHLEELKVEPLYVSQWFLSFFAVTCPLPMLLRIYDVILSEGATETLMRVALSLMQRNENKLLAFTEFEDAMQFLLSRSLWDTYAQHADDMVSDFVALTGWVTYDSLTSLEASFKQSQVAAQPSFLKSAATSLIGRFWATSSHISTKSGNLSLTIPNNAGLRKSSSGQSLISTLDSVGTSASEASTAPTELSEDGNSKPSLAAESTGGSNSAADRDLHQQIEELLTALSHLQRQQVEMSQELQKEREERVEDLSIGRELLSRLRKQTEAINELAGGDTDEADLEDTELLEKAERQFNPSRTNRLSILQTKHQLRDAADEWRAKHDVEATRARELSRQLDEREAEQAALKEHLRDARARIQTAHQEKQRLDRTVQDLRSRTSSAPDSPCDLYSPISPPTEFGELKLPAPKPGLREFRLGKTDQQPPRTTSLSTTTFSKRSSSLNAAAIMASESAHPAQHDALLLELVNAKTGEAVAKQELEETKAKLDALRKILGGPTSSPLGRVVSGDCPSSLSPSSASATTPKENNKPAHTASASTSGGFFSGWGRRG